MHKYYFSHDAESWEMRAVSFCTRMAKTYAERKDNNTIYTLVCVQSYDRLDRKVWVIFLRSFQHFFEVIYNIVWLKHGLTESDILEKVI